MALSFAAHLVVLVSIFSSYTSALSVARRATHGAFQIQTPAAFIEASADAITQNFASLEASHSRTNKRSAAYVKALHERQHARKSSGLAGEPIAPLTAANHGYEYLVDLTIGKQTAKFILDTGSSDTWAIQKGFQCQDFLGRNETEDTCNFGAVYDGVFAKGKIPDQFFSISYGDGEYLTGDMGFEDVTIAGVTVSQQEVSCHYILGHLSNFDLDLN